VHWPSLRTFARVLSLVVALPMTGCGGGDAPPAATFPVVVFSDVHFDPLYDPALCAQVIAEDPARWPAILARDASPSPWGSDTNYALLARALEGVAANRGPAPVVIFTGDILGHYLAEQFFRCHDAGATPTPGEIAAMKAFTDRTVAFFVQQVRAALGDVPVMFALGNADSYWGLGPDRDSLARTAETYYGLVRGTVDHDTFVATVTQGGFYTADLPGSSLRVVALNTFEFSPAFEDTKYAEVMAQLDWFEQALESLG
jgi:3',5'-cyclic AMP phosphodiesterase CpdA